MRARFAVLLAVALSVRALGQGAQGEGLDLRTADYADGPPVAALPPVRQSGRIDQETYRVLYAALRERLDARLVSLEATVKAVEHEKLGQKLGTTAARDRLAEVLNAQVLVVLDAPSGRVEARLYASPAAPASAEAFVPLGRGKRVTQALARQLIDELVKKGDSVLRSAQLVDLTPPPMPVSEGPDDTENVAAQATGQRPVTPRASLEAPRLLVMVGAGPGFRSFSASSQSPLVPQSPAVMTALGVTLAVFPVRFVPSLADGPLGDLWLEGFYRRNLVQATVDSSGASPTSRTCAVADDEVLGRIGYRYALGGSLPRLGVGAGVAWERTDFACDVSTLDTGYGSSELHLKALQPILGEVLTVELSGGPRFLFSTRAAHRDTLAFSGDLWLTGRPMRYLTVRAGARVTGTKLTSWPEGVALYDVRTFVGVEVGAAL